MNLITKHHLSTLRDDEVRALYRDEFQRLTKSSPYSPQRRNALASLENISAEMAARIAECA